LSSDVRDGFRLNDSIRLLPGGAVLLPEAKALLISDLHLGCEAALEYEGLSIPRIQTRRIREYLTGLIDNLDVSRMIIVGDLKHNFSRNLVQEWQDVSSFLSDFSSRLSIEVVKGNHDNYLGLILREHSIPLVNEMEVCGIRILHGHQGSLDDRPTIIGHLHPSLVLRDTAGASVKDNCFLFNERQYILVLPAQSILAGGVDVVRQSSSDTISPLIAEGGLGGFVPIVFTGNKALRFPEIRKIREKGRV